MLTQTDHLLWTFLDRLGSKTINQFLCIYRSAITLYLLARPAATFDMGNKWQISFVVADYFKRYFWKSLGVKLAQAANVFVINKSPIHGFFAGLRSMTLINHERLSATQHAW